MSATQHAPAGLAGARGRAGPRRWDPVSMLALVTAVAALVPVAIPLAIAGLVRTLDPTRRGRGAAVAALLVCALWLAVAFVVAAFVIVFVTADRSGATDAGAVAGLRSGDCLATAPTPSAARVDVVRCTTPHGAQVFATFRQPVTDFSDEQARAAAAQRACLQRLPATVAPLPRSMSVAAIVEPPAPNATRRAVACVAVTGAGRLRTSLPGLEDPLAKNSDPRLPVPGGRRLPPIT